MIPRVRMRSCSLVGWCLLAAGALLAADEAVTEETQPPVSPLQAALETRYAPYADWEGLIAPDRVSDVSEARYWRTPDVIRAGRTVDAPALAGLRVALDPGHIGGIWAEAEGRHFRISETDYWVREGELVLLVARLLESRLSALGAEVVLLREDATPVNPKRPIDYVEGVVRRRPLPLDGSMASLTDYIVSVRDEATRLAVVSNELQARANRVNREIRPDAFISLHINAAVWPETEDGSLRLVPNGHSHVLIFGCLTPSEIKIPRQQEALAVKLGNGSGPVELELGAALAASLGAAMGLPPSVYNKKNAVLPYPEEPYLWARNLMLLRTVECPSVLLEPFLANSVDGYTRIQNALTTRAAGEPPAEDDILVSYADAVVAGVLAVYGPEAE
ncbi:N-acetylmuramoyl-L-alanine amidase family protein [Coraliomargarita parva]|uniref:N-acetylmuramoyl-L-alanine amidase family protein n=1 Tax=Coraliomargarita parva TaxID=3014050 RepID=UPI0022B3423D|nr:N-acetylmuramoyl-L-alanine amidase [Coraliomargarita parva]